MPASDVQYFDPATGLWGTLLSGGSVPGPPGDSAYQIAVDNGFVGTEQEWLASLSVMARTVAQYDTNWYLKDDATDQMVFVTGQSTIWLPEMSHNLWTIKNVGADTVTVQVESWQYLEGAAGGLAPLLPGEAVSLFMGEGYNWWRMAGTTVAGGLSQQARHEKSLLAQITELRDRLTVLEDEATKKTTRSRSRKPQGGQ